MPPARRLLPGYGGRLLGLLRVRLGLTAEQTEAQIYTFLPAVGGAGVTTLAVQSAMMLLNSGGQRGKASTCLVDLDFQHGACADYLDLEPRLDLKEIEPRPERVGESPPWLKKYGLEGEELSQELVEGPLLEAARKKVAEGRLSSLASMVLMGVNRIVVNDGIIRDCVHAHTGRK